MDRYTATRIALRICLLAISVAPARGQEQQQEQEPVQVGELMVTPAPDGVTVTLARDGDTSAMPDRPAQLPKSTITRITLVSDELPPVHQPSAQQSPQPYMQPAARWRPLPPLPAPRTHDMERDVQTLKAARAAMQLDDQMHGRRIAALR
ncbi:hypothetical protein GJ700_07485 [Duganella sp. FT92W]|uniref:Uncharacterized protein n=1 Tax=Pseudoduganella rivuli TaxID=2666085 RepID=A0A7X2LQP2_9BURK|nr:hypothetical protein [Pseudoduganella rivuli]MRV71565.1 hypothetical protein [Pseudoduganella rivuli]